MKNHVNKNNLITAKFVEVLYLHNVVFEGLKTLINVLKIFYEGTFFFKKNYICILVYIVLSSTL